MKDFANVDLSKSFSIFNCFFGLHFQGAGTVRVVTIIARPCPMQMKGLAHGQGLWLTHAPCQHAHLSVMLSCRYSEMPMIRFTAGLTHQRNKSRFK